MRRKVIAACLAFALAGCAAQPSPPAAAPAGSSATATAPAPVPAASNARAAGWITLAVGAQATAVALGTSVMLLRANSVRDSECNAQKVCSPDGADANHRIGSLAGWNAGAWAVAAVGLGAGAYLLWTNPADSTTRTAIGVGPNGLNVRGSF